MRYLILPIIIVICMSAFNYVSAQEELWTRAYYFDEFAGGNDIVINPNGGYFWAGMIQPEDHSLGRQALLVSINSPGDTIWTRSYGRGEDESFNSIQIVDDQIWLTGSLDSSDVFNHYRMPFFMIANLEGEVVHERWYEHSDPENRFFQVATPNHPFIYAEVGSSLVVRLDENGEQIWSAFQPPDESFWGLSSISLLPEGGILASLVRSESDSDSISTCLAWISESGELEDTMFVREQFETLCPFITVLSQDEVIVAGSTRNGFVFYDDYPIMARVSRESDDPVWQIVRDFVGFEYTSIDTVNGALWASFTTYHTELGPAPVFVSSYDLDGNEIGGLSVYPEINGYNLGSSSTSNGGNGIVIIGNGARDSSYVWLTEIVSSSDAIESQAMVTYSSLRVYPNPFNSITTLTLSLPWISNVEVSLYDITGRYVKQIAQERMTAGEHSLNVDAAGLPSGIYFVQAKANQYSAARKIVLVR